MLARLILALMLAAFALPALANGPCHDAPGPRVHDAMHHGTPVPDDRAARLAHVCIGCIPPASVLPVALAAPALARALPRRIVVAPFAPRAGVPPALPPPRTTA